MLASKASRLAHEPEADEDEDEIAPLGKSVEASIESY